MRVEGVPVLEVVDVHKRFGGVAALAGVSLEVRENEVCGLIGPNGAGKTTLFDVVSGTTAPTRGRVLLDGKDVTGELPERRSRAGMRRTYQHPQLFVELTVEDNVLTAMEWRGGGGGLVADVLGLRARRRVERKRRERVRILLEECGLKGMESRLAGSLPVGTARLVELARAIVDGPRLLLLDEPTSGLTEAESECFARQIERLRGEGVSVVLVEHDVRFVMEHSTRVVALNFGAVLAEGTPEEIQEHPEVQAAYLG